MSPPGGRGVRVLAIAVVSALLLLTVGASTSGIEIRPPPVPVAVGHAAPIFARQGSVIGGALRQAGAGTAAATTPVWPTFLYDAARSGSNPNERTIATSNVSGLTQLWSVSTKGINTGSVIDVNGTVYFGSWDGRLYAVNAYNGSLRWKTLLGGSSDYTRCGEPGVAGTPAYWNGTLYIGGSSPSLYAVNATSGVIVWSLDLANATGAVSAWSAHKIWASPLLYNGSIYEGIASGCDNPLVRGQFFQIGLSDHKVDHLFDIVPSGEVGGGIWGSAAVDPKTNSIWITTGNEGVSTQTYARALLELNASNVTNLLGYWQEGTPYADLDFGDGATLFHSATGTPMVVAVNKDGWAYAFNESGVKKSGSGTPAWTLQLSSYYGESISPPAFGGGYLYFGSVSTYLGGNYVNGTLQAVDPGTGASSWTDITQWPVYAGLVYANGVVAVGQFGPAYNTGEITLVDAQSGAYLENLSTVGGVWGEPIILNGELIYAAGNLSGTGGQVRAYSLPLGGRVTAVPVTGTSESTYRLSGAPSGGLPPFNLSWQFGDGGTAYGGSVTHSYGLAGSYHGTLTVRDGANSTFVRSFNLSANAPLAASGTLSANPVNLGNATTASTSVAGGTLPYAYAWSGLPPGVTANGTAIGTVRVASAVEGEFNLSVVVSSPSGQATTVRFPPLWIDGPTQYTVSASPLLGIVPLWVQFSAASAYPNATGTYAWQFGDGAVSSKVAPSHLYFATGRFPVALTVQYAGGTVGTGSAVVNVYAPFSSSLTPFAEVDRGMPFTLTANVTGGVGTYSFEWAGLPGPCRTANLSTLTCRPTATGSFSVALTVADPLGGTSVLYASVLVNPSLEVSAVVGTPAELTCGGPTSTSVGLSANVAGGTPPYAVNWSGPGGTSYTGLNVQPRLPGPGNYSFDVNATDLVGGSVQTKVSVLVPPASCAAAASSLWSGSGGITLVAGLVLAAGVAAVGTVWWVRRRRAAGTNPEAVDPTDPTGPS